MKPFYNGNDVFLYTYIWPTPHHLIIPHHKVDKIIYIIYIFFPTDTKTSYNLYLNVHRLIIYIVTIEMNHLFAIFLLLFFIIKKILLFYGKTISILTFLLI